MNYMLMAIEDEDAFTAREDPDRSGAYWAAWTGYLQALEEAAVLVSAGGLQPPGSATTVRLREGRRLLQDGPFADTKEQLGGYFVIDVPDLDAALGWAARCPCAGDAAVEVRPLLPAGTR